MKWTMNSIMKPAWGDPPSSAVCEQSSPYWTWVRKCCTAIDKAAVAWQHLTWQHLHGNIYMQQASA